MFSSFGFGCCIAFTNNSSVAFRLFEPTDCNDDSVGLLPIRPAAVLLSLLELSFEGV